MNKHKLVPVGPTDDELIAWAGEEQFFLFCDKDDFLDIARSVLQRYAGRSPDVKGEPVVPEGFRLIAVNETFDSLTFWLDRCEQKGHLENCADLVEPWESFEYREVEAPQPEPDVSELVEALEELVDLMEDTRQGEYAPDSFTTQPARIALATYRKQGGEA